MPLRARRAGLAFAIMLAFLPFLVAWAAGAREQVHAVDLGTAPDRRVRAGRRVRQAMKAPKAWKERLAGARPAWDTHRMRRFLLPPLLLSILLLAGCPFSSELPLSDPGSAGLDAGLLGAWKAQDADTGEWRIFTFKVFNEHELVGLTPGDAKDSVDAFRVFSTEIGTERFLNVQELGVDDKAWYLVRYRLDAGKLVLSVVDDQLFAGRSFASSAALLEFVRQNLADLRLYAASGEERVDMVWERADVPAA